MTQLLQCSISQIKNNVVHFAGQEHVSCKMYKVSFQVWLEYELWLGILLKILCLLFEKFLCEFKRFSVRKTPYFHALSETAASVLLRASYALDGKGQLAEYASETCCTCNMLLTLLVESPGKMHTWVMIDPIFICDARQIHNTNERVYCILVLVASWIFIIIQADQF